MKIGCVLAAGILCHVTYAQNSSIVTAAEVRQHMDDKSKPIHIINFWATWCGPCVKELPYFDAVTAAGNPDVQVTLVSMDLDLDPDPEKVYRFIARKGARKYNYKRHFEDRGKGRGVFVLRCGFWSK